MRLFISYTRSDANFVDSLATKLESYGVDIWRDLKDISVGDSITNSIADGIDQSDYFCLVLSKASISKPWVLREYQTALNRQLSSAGKAIVVLPLLLEKCDIPELLIDIQYADFSVDYTKGFDSLGTALKLNTNTKIIRQTGSLCQQPLTETIQSFR